MSKRFHIPSWGYKLLLLVAAAVWGLGTVVLKDDLEGRADRVRGGAQGLGHEIAAIAEADNDGDPRPR